MKILSNENRLRVSRTKFIPSGGTTIFAKNFSSYLIQHGHTWIGVEQYISTTNTGAMRRRKMAPGYSLYTLFSPAKHYKSLYRSRSRIIPKEYFSDEITRLRYLIVAQAPDVVFINGFSTYAWLLLTAASAEGIPIVMQHAGILSIEVEMYADHFSAAARHMLFAMEQDTILSATEHVFLNQTSRAAFGATVGTVPPAQSHIIPLPCEKALIGSAPTAHHSPQTPLRIGCVARWDRIKNHKAVLQVAKTAHALKFPWIFESVTSIPKTAYCIQTKSAYRRFITVHPPMERAALKRFYESMDLMLLPSHFDVSPTVVLEAALAGVPTLITPEVGWADTYRHHKLGAYIMDFSDPKKVVHRIQILQRQRTTPAFRRFLLQNHAPERTFAAYVRLFRSVC